MRILKADATLLDALVEFNRVVQDLHVEKEPVFFRPFDAAAVGDFFQSALDNPAVTVLVAVEGEEPLGYVLLRVQDRPANAFSPARRFLELEHIAVMPRARNRGLGAALVDGAFVVAKSLGLDGLELSVWNFNNSAQRLFHKRGFAPCLHRMRARCSTSVAVQEQ